MSQNTLLSKDDLLTILNPITTSISWARQHPSILFSLLVIYGASIGYVYERAFYLEFEINILNYSRYDDLFLGWLRNPAVLRDAIHVAVLIFSCIASYALTVYFHSITPFKIQGLPNVVDSIYSRASEKTKDSIYALIIPALLFSAYYANFNQLPNSTSLLNWSSIILALILGALPAVSIASQRAFSKKAIDHELAHHLGTILIFSSIAHYLVILFLFVTVDAKIAAGISKKPISDGITVKYQNGGKTISIENARAIGATNQFQFFMMKDRKVVALSKSVIEQIQFNKSEP